MHKLFTALLSVVALSVVLVAAEVWKVKPVREWSREETRDFLRNSPWVRQITAGGSLVEMQPPMGEAQTAQGRGESSSASERTGNPELDVGGRGPMGATIYFIEWTSARIVRQASLHLGTLQGRVKEGSAEPPDLGVYVLSLGGQDLRAFLGVTEAQLKAAAYLRLKRAKTTVEPTEVKIRKTPDDRIVSVQFAFPHEVNGQPVISDQEKSADFTCKVKNLTLKASFELNKMTTEKGRDL